MLSKRERKKQEVAEHNLRYEAEKARLSNMSKQEIFDEQLATATKNAVAELMPHARKIITEEK